MCTKKHVLIKNVYKSTKHDPTPVPSLSRDDDLWSEKTVVAVSKEINANNLLGHEKPIDFFKKRHIGKQSFLLSTPKAKFTLVVECLLYNTLLRILGLQNWEERAYYVRIITGGLL